MHDVAGSGSQATLADSLALDKCSCAHDCCSRRGFQQFISSAETVVLANALKDDRVTIISIEPGWVATDL